MRVGRLHKGDVCEFENNTSVQETWLKTTIFPFCRRVEKNDLELSAW